MSYLDYPKLHFSGRFLANVATINNTPNNYNPEITYNTDGQMELYWNPDGDNVFDFVECTVTKVSYEDGSVATDDPIVGKTIVCVHTPTSGPLELVDSNPKTAPKLVDLDPMQQNVSEIWGMQVLVGELTGEYVVGDFAEAPFTGIWQQSQGPETPHSSASGSAVYQSLLTSLTFSDSEPLASRCLEEWNQNSDTALSINFVVRAHNNSPQIYAINDVTEAAMLAEDVPSEVIDQLEPMSHYIQNTPRNDDPLDVNTTEGNIPTLEFFEKALQYNLNDNDFSQYKDKIITAAEQPPEDSTPYDFPHGEVAGTIGPHSDGEPTYFTPARMLCPNSDPDFPDDEHDTHTNFYAPFQTKRYADKYYAVINLGNALPTELPAQALIDQGKLCLCYFDLNGSAEISADNAVVLDNSEIDYQASNFFNQSAGIVQIEIEDGYIECVENNPMGIVRVIDEMVEAVVLNENIDGYYLRADKFVYRMNLNSTSPSRGNEATIDFYVTQFGEPVAGVNIEVSLMDSATATDYTNGTMGTGGTQGVEGLSEPQSAIVIEDTTATTDGDGKASILVSATNPDNPRAYIDGQIYFLNYGFSSSEIDFQQASDDVISIQIYDTMVSGDPLTWDGDIRDILSQYGKLYPIMDRFGLGNYDSVKEHADKIKGVLTRDFNHPLYMPVVRDMSDDRTAMIIQWIDDGCLEIDNNNFINEKRRNINKKRRKS